MFASRISRQWVSIAAACVLAVGAVGCAGPVDTSKAYSRSVIEGGGIIQAGELRVAEYLNYYE